MRVGGLASGMDTDSIVKDMMKIQKMPLDKLMQQKTFTEWQQEATRDTNLSMTNLRTSASNLRLQSSFNSYSATSPTPNSFTVATTANAMSGSYQVQITSVASAAKLNSANSVTNSAGTAAKSTDQIGVAGRITIGDISIDVASTDTFADVAKNLQDKTAASVPALRASFDNTTSRFFIATKGMGADQNFTLEFKNADGTAASTELANKIMNNSGATSATATGAADGEIMFDNIKIEGLKTNQTTVNGVTVSLLQAGTEVTINVQSNPEKPLAMIKDFVDKYNETIENLQKQLVEKRYPDFQPLSDEQKKDMTEKEIELWEDKARSGLLRNDPVLKSAMQDLRRAFMDSVTGLAEGNINHLSQIGINTGSYTEGGKLFIDEKKLSEALTNKPDEVMALFTTRDAAGNGVGARVYDTLNNIVKNLSEKAGSSSSSVDNSTLSKKIKQMNDEISRWQDRLTRVEDRYWKQFTAMEKALSQMNSQSAWMQQNLFGGA
ncbi:flagellar filament capping protein FliD [Microbacterium sp. APC 3898]|uniref:Flagellar hook-associated protein 2 n=1 Tax=Planococcus notacanthi TaxID=3035188 RepID=A0ABT7ZL36_9BACL|nr:MULTISPECIES: flagellar filament capping protein FliD [Terrabacteria group]MDN3427878.1 flagellar filament capping protein FliD [Planococcus sp. APC 4016]MDN3498587.1 flagellar filament capping protein FliD [Microbacterium sp. APC 3898]